MPFDTHCHLTASRLAPDLDAVLERARAALSGVLTIGTGLADAAAAATIRKRHPGFVHLAAGLDPFTCLELGDGAEAACDDLAAFLTAHRCLAVGEFGLEYHHPVLPRPRQISLTHRQLDLAQRLDLPAILHVRDAHDDLLAVLAEHPRARGIIHSFSGDAALAARYLALGWHLSFSGMVTFTHNAGVAAAADLTPADRLLVETDAPYLTPVPLRGKRNEPANLVHTVAFLAARRGMAAGDLAAQTADNARRLLGLQDPAIGR